LNASVSKNELEILKQRVHAKILQAFHPFTVKLERGKYLRTELIYLFGQEYGLPPRETENIAFAIESVHTGSLLIDDLVDGQKLRRQFKTLWQKVGGKKTVSLAFLLIVKSLKEFSHDYPQYAVFLIKALEKMSLGESFLITQETYLKICEHKTGVLFMLSCLLPALMSGQNSEEIKKLYQFSKHLGRLYQIQDDCRDQDTPLSNAFLNKIQAQEQAQLCQKKSQLTLSSKTQLHLTQILTQYF